MLTNALSPPSLERFSVHLEKEVGLGWWNVCFTQDNKFLCGLKWKHSSDYFTGHRVKRLVPFLGIVRAKWVVPENIHTHHKVGHWKFRGGGGGVSKANIFKGKYEAKLEIPGERGFKPKRPSVGGMDIFWNHTMAHPGGYSGCKGGCKLKKFIGLYKKPQKIP